ncbi:Mediator of RNA polymerase II transcription subunit 25 [Homalodisca vitripennis]|nr:Mediator of RNA polymerase II transcription subunit 25 [Homalodisca vitripennis]
MAYFGPVHPHLMYGLRLWGSCSKYKFERVFRSQKKAVRIISKFKSRNSCRDAFRELGLLTLPCLYILDVALFCRFKCEFVRGRDVYQYGTRGRDNLRLHPHRTATFKRLPSEASQELHTIWQGMLEWIEKSKTPNDAQKNTRHVPCQVSAHSKDGEPELKADSWPQKLIMQLIPKQLIENIGGAYLKNSKSVLFYPQPCEALESLTRMMCSGFVSVIL